LLKRYIDTALPSSIRGLIIGPAPWWGAPQKGLPRPSHEGISHTELARPRGLETPLKPLLADADLSPVSSVESPARASPSRLLLLSPNAVEEPAVGESRSRLGERPAIRDWSALLIVGGGFLATSFALLVLVDSSRSPGIWASVFVVSAYALVSRLEYEVGVGSVVPTQLILVPMLFVFPLGQVPLLVFAGLLGGAAVDVAVGRLHPKRVALTMMDAWHAVGPVVVLALAGEGPPRLDQAPLYLGALLAQFGAEFASCVVRDRISRGISTVAQLRYTLRSAPIDAALAPVGLCVAFVAYPDPLAIVLVLPLVWLLGVFASERRAGIDNALELRDAYRGTALLLGDVVEADDSYTGLHSRDVVHLSLAVADELGLDQSARRDTEFAALLHDVGKIRIPGEIINKPGRLTPEERAVMETHTIEGEKMLAQVGGLLGTIGGIVRSCHERWDGNGYPDGLAGEAIPRVARIVACCDAFSAMTTDRSYRKALPFAAAVTELRTHAGTQFDPTAVEALIGVVERGATSGRPTG